VGQAAPAKARSLAAGGLPLGLAHDVKLVRPVKKGQSLSWADVAMDTTHPRLHAAARDGSAVRRHGALNPLSRPQLPGLLASFRRLSPWPGRAPCRLGPCLRAGPGPACRTPLYTPTDKAPAHDAGAAALALWQGRFGQRSLVDGIEQALDGAQLLMSGTSWTSPLEHHARLQAAQRGLRSVGVLDHWLGYAARFQRDGHRVLPDEVWVVDAEAYALARTSFPGPGRAPAAQPAPA
jgi:hypothetical protein